MSACLDRKCNAIHLGGDGRVVRSRGGKATRTKTLQLHDWTLRVDAEATTAFYETRTPLACDCGHCRNFIAAYPVLPPSVRSVFADLGIDPRREGGEVYELGTNDDGTLIYSGVMVLIGEIVEQTEGYRTAVGSATHINPTDLVDGLSGGFVEEDSLVAVCVPDQPEPHIVLEFNLERVPWVLDEDPSGEL